MNPIHEEDDEEPIYGDAIVGSSWWHSGSYIDMTHLCQLERTLLATAFSSQTLFETISSRVSTEDFTFVIHQMIFDELLKNSGDVGFFGSNERKAKIARHINSATRLLRFSVYHTLDEVPSKKLEADMFELLDFSRHKREVIKDAPLGRSESVEIVIEDVCGEHIAEFVNGVVTKVDTIDSFKLPPELCDTFSLTIDKILPYIGHNDYDMSLTFKDDSDEIVERIFFKKEIHKIEYTDKLVSLLRQRKDFDKLPICRCKLFELATCDCEVCTERRNKSK